ncbi:MAG: TIGR04206 family protein [Haloarculaceae archaeon]
MDSKNRYRRLLVYAACFLVPWSVVNARGVVTLVFPFGLLNFAPLELTDVVSFATVYSRGLPDFLLGWPVGVGLYLAGLASVLSGLAFDREDPRLTAGLFVFAGVTQVTLVLGFSRRAGTTAVPVGAVLLWFAVWWFDWPAIRRTLSVEGS